MVLKVWLRGTALLIPMTPNYSSVIFKGEVLFLFTHYFNYWLIDAQVVKLDLKVKTKYTLVIMVSFASTQCLVGN